MGAQTTPKPCGGDPGSEYQLQAGAKAAASAGSEPTALSMATEKLEPPFLPQRQP